jgi:hypothetical protein
VAGASEGRRVLTEVPWARSRALPWAVRRRLVAREIRRRSSERLPARLAAVRYAEPTALRPARATGPASPYVVGPIWQFWASGADNVPPVVARAMESVQRHADGRPVVVLDASSYRDYVTLPPHLDRLGEQVGWTHFSDVLRVYLLREHGGTWMDATLRLSAPMPADLVNGPLFAFGRPEDPFVLSSWLLHAAPGHPLVRALAAMLDAYWRENDELVDYFLSHFLVEAAVTVDRDLRRQWLDVPVCDHRPPHLLQAELAEPFDAHRLAQIEAQSWAHKLTWRVSDPAPDSFAQWLSEN